MDFLSELNIKHYTVCILYIIPTSMRVSVSPAVSKQKHADKVDEETNDRHE